MERRSLESRYCILRRAAPGLGGLNFQYRRVLSQNCSSLLAVVFLCVFTENVSMITVTV
jgi:hypothetical protein